MPQVKTVEAKIFSLEGFKVKILTAEGADVRSDKLLEAQFDQHTNRAAGGMTVAGRGGACGGAERAGGGPHPVHP